MASLRRCCVCLLSGLFLILSASAQELPTKAGPEDLEAEAKKLMDDLPSLSSLQKEADTDAQFVTPVPNEDAEVAVERTKTALERVRKKQQRWEKLARQGVLSRAEAEGCVVEVADALAKHERARVALLRQQMTSLQERAAKGEVDKTMVESAEAALQSAIGSSASAEKQARQARLEAAKNNLDRHRKLFAAGLVSRTQLQRAESAFHKVEADGQEPRSLE